MLLNEKEVGTVSIRNGVMQSEDLFAKAGKYELKLRFEEKMELEILEIFF